MSLKTVIIDGTGSQQQSVVDDSGALFVQPMAHPPFMSQKVFPFSRFLTIDGASSGTSDMTVAGSLAVPITFSIKSNDDNDVYISSLSFVISGQNATLNQFGNIGALTNGIDLFYDRIDMVVTIKTGMKSNFDFVQLACGQPAFGNGTTSFRASNVIGNVEAYIPCIDLARFGLVHGVKLDAGTKQQLGLKIQDNLTTVNSFTCLAAGFQRIP